MGCARWGLATVALRDPDRQTNSSPIPHCWGVRNDRGQRLSVEVRVGVLVWRQDKNEKNRVGMGKVCELEVEVEVDVEERDRHKEPEVL